MNTTLEQPLSKEELNCEKDSLDVFFNPRSVAVIGASDRTGSVGRGVLQNMIAAPFKGSIYPINPRHNELFGLKTYASVADVPGQVDLSIIATPAHTVPGIVDECITVGSRGAVILSGGFKECGAEGMALEGRIREQVKGRNFRIIGPNCLGVMIPRSGLNATFADGMALDGSAALISQSGAICTAILGWSQREKVGFSAFVSIGSMLDIAWSDLIDYLSRDAKTQSILLYMESLGDARAFVSAAREAALKKPIVVLKSGRTDVAAKAAASHTGALAGSDEALDAVFDRCGVLRVDTIAELFYMSEALTKQRRPKGPNLTIVTNAGGPAVLAADSLIRSGGTLSTLCPQTCEAIYGVLPLPHYCSNPIDILGDADPQRFADVVTAAEADPNTDGLLVILTPQSMTDPTTTANKIVKAATGFKKPIITSWMGGDNVAHGRSILTDNGIPSFPFPDTAARIFHNMWRYQDRLELLYATPLPVKNGGGQTAGNTAGPILDTTRREGRVLLSEIESKNLLAAYGIPTVKTLVARSEAQAIQCAQEVGYPVVLKLHSESITHKSDVGGVRLDIRDSATVRSAYKDIEKAVQAHAGDGHFQGVTVQPMVDSDGCELILGSSVDPQIGPIILFGAGGLLVEVLRDRALSLPPLSTTHALHMMRQTKIFTALKGIRGRPPVDLQSLAEILVRFSRLVVEEPQIKEIDINPLVATGNTIIALDARIILERKEDMAQRPGLAIRPYPVAFESISHLSDGKQVLIRPIRPEDEVLLKELHADLSPTSIARSCFGTVSMGKLIDHRRLARICCLDYDREIALVAIGKDTHSGRQDMMGIARLLREVDTSRAEFSVIVSEHWHGKRIGAQLIRQLLNVALSESITTLYGEVLEANQPMLNLCRQSGFSLKSDNKGIVRAEIDLRCE